MNDIINQVFFVKILLNSANIKKVCTYPFYYVILLLLNLAGIPILLIAEYT